MGSKSYLWVSAAVFDLVALAHLLRLILRLPVQIGDLAMPMWVSVAGFLGMSALSLWGIATACRR